MTDSSAQVSKVGDDSTFPPELPVRPEVLPDILSIGGPLSLSLPVGYERSRWTVLLFFVIFVYAVRNEVRSFLAIPILASIVVVRLSPEWLVDITGVLRTSLREDPSARSEATESGSGKLEPSPFLFSCCPGLLLVAFAYLAFASLRGTYGPNAPHFAQPSAPLVSPLGLAEDVDRNPHCSSLGGLDCSRQLSEWAGRGACAVLVNTNGTCHAYCERHGTRCVKAADNAGWPCMCRLHSGKMIASEESCLQDWRTQICVCSEPSRPTSAATPAMDEDSSVDVGTISRPATPVAPSSTTPLLQVHAEAVGPCFKNNVKRVPDMPGSRRRTAENSEECQAQCQRTDGCAFFTWHFHSGDCSLHEYDSQELLARNVISGPSGCDDEKDLEYWRSSWSGTTPSTTPPLRDKSRDASGATHRLSDPEGHAGSYYGPINAEGKAYGRGELHYDDEPDLIFRGDFIDGRLFQGVVFQGQRIHSTMRDFEWTEVADEAIIDLISPSSDQVKEALHGQEPSVRLPQQRESSTPDHFAPQYSDQPVQPSPQPVEQSEITPSQSHVEASTPPEAFMTEGSPYVVALVVIVFVALAVSGVLDRKES